MVKAQDGNAVALSSPTSLEDTRKIWYFAYGSNMRASVMQNRGIAAIAKEIAVVPSHVLSFDVFGVPYSEPAMGSITRRKDLPLDKANYVPSVHGVACLVSHADYVRLLVSEGAGTAYKEVELDAFIIPVGEKTYGNGVKEEDGKTRPRPITIKVHTLVARYPFRPNAPPRPSRRYLDLLIQGAAEHGLPAAYQAYLESLPAFTKDTSRLATTGASVFHFLWLPLIQRVMRWVKGAAVVENGVSPQWTGTVVWIIFTTMWMYHDCFHARIWGRGDGRLASEVSMAC